MLCVSILHRVSKKKSSPFHLVHSYVAEMAFFLEHRSLHSLPRACKVFFIRKGFSGEQRNVASAICL